MFKKMHLVVLIMLWPGYVNASGIAHFKGVDNGNAYTFNFEYLNQTTSRLNLNTGTDGEGYLLFNNRQAQMVSNYQGNTLVMDLESMNQMAQNFGAMKMLGVDSETLLIHVISMTATGRNETVAGIKGEVYRVDWMRNNIKQQDEVVLSRSPRAWAYTSAWIDALEVVSKASSSIEIKGDELLSKIKKEKLGILRFGDQLKLVSAQSNAINPARFIAPEISFTIPSLGDLFGNL